METTIQIRLRCSIDGSSRQEEATLECNAIGHCWRIDSHNRIPVLLSSIKVSERLGNTPRQLHFVDGALCETRDNDALDRMLAGAEIDRFGRWLHHLESNFRHVLVAILLTIATTWIAISVGIPALSKEVSSWIPVGEGNIFGADTLSVLDRILFEPSQLTDEETRTARLRFQRLEEIARTQTGGENYAFQLVFRNGGELGANALALPSGTIVVTDQLVMLAKNADEIESILAHEIGHVVHRHTLRQLIQNSTVGLLIMALTGDVSTASALAASLPTLLVEMHYSREFEREADAYALAYLRQMGINPAVFTAILGRIVQDAGEGDAENRGGFLSTHPGLEERAQSFVNET